MSPDSILVDPLLTNMQTTGKANKNIALLKQKVMEYRDGGVDQNYVASYHITMYAFV